MFERQLSSGGELIREAADQIERGPRLPKRISDAMKQAGILAWLYQKPEAAPGLVPLSNCAWSERLRSSAHPIRSDAMPEWIAVSETSTQINQHHPPSIVIVFDEKAGQMMLGVKPADHRFIIAAAEELLAGRR